MIYPPSPDILYAHSPVLNVLPPIRIGRHLGIPVVYEIRAFWDDAAVDQSTTREGGLRYWLGIKPSYARPRVSDDNAYAASLFRTAKYRPEFPVRGFADLGQARTWAAGFVHWYNFDHCHSDIRYVSPAQRHAGDDHAILAARHEVYLKARDINPARWSGATRNWTPIGAVTLNSERDAIIKTHLGGAIFNRWLHD